MLKSPFLEELAVLDLNMTGFTEVVQKSHTGGSLIPHMWTNEPKKFFFHMKFSAKQTIQLTSCKRFDNNCYHILCIAIAMITVVIETFARCQLYRLLWP